MHVYAENEPTMKSNEATLNEIPGNATQKSLINPDNCKHPLTLIQAAQNQNQASTSALEKVMLTVNKRIQDRLINGQTRINSHIEFAQGNACRIYVF